MQAIADFGKQALGKIANEDELVMQTLAIASNVCIQQVPNWIEICGICEIENVYNIHVTNNNFDFNELQKPVAVFKEKSNICCRCFLKCAREFEGNLSVGAFNVSKIRAPYKCHNPIPICSMPCSRPEILVTNNSDEYIGKVTMPCYCPGVGMNNCDTMELRVQDKDNNLIYLIAATCCQKPVWCMPFQCCGCEKIEYTIKDTMKQVVGKIYNLYNDCIKETCSRADKFGINFPDNAEPHKKLLLIQATIWIDYLQYFA